MLCGRHNGSRVPPLTNRRDATKRTSLRRMLAHSSHYEVLRRQAAVQINTVAHVAQCYHSSLRTVTGHGVLHWERKPDHLCRKLSVDIPVTYTAVTTAEGPRQMNLHASHTQCIWIDRQACTGSSTQSVRLTHTKREGMLDAAVEYIQLQYVTASSCLHIL
jgi:hypothetical protein